MKSLFCNNVQHLWDKISTRPSGEVELLLGGNQLGLHPTDVEVVGNLKVKKSKFGSGFLLCGSHPNIVSSQCYPGSSHVQASVRATRLSYKSVREYFDSNELNVETPRRCRNCMNCDECTYQGHKMSLVEQFEYKTIKSNIK